MGSDSKHGTRLKFFSVASKAEAAHRRTMEPAFQLVTRRVRPLVPLLGKVAVYVPLLVLSTSLHLVARAEHRIDGPAQRLRTVDHEQTRPLGIQAPLDQVFEQCRGNDFVFACSFPKTKNVLATLRIHTNYSDGVVFAEHDPVQVDERGCPTRRAVAPSAPSAFPRCLRRSDGWPRSCSLQPSRPSSAEPRRTSVSIDPASTPPRSAGSTVASRASPRTPEPELPFLRPCLFSSGAACAHGADVPKG